MACKSPISSPMFFLRPKPPAALLPVNNPSYNAPPTKSPTTPNPTSEPPQPSPAQTRYTGMLLNLDTIPWSHNLLASFSTWILLAGFLIVPGTFTSIEKSQVLEAHARENAIADKILDEVKHASLLYIAFTCCLVGGSGLLWLWWRWRSNYVWLINKIFM